MTLAAHPFEALRWIAPAVVLSAAGAWAARRYLRHVGRLMIQGAFRRHLNSHLMLRSLDAALAGASTFDQRWEIICNACKQFGFSKVEIRMAGWSCAATLAEIRGQSVWSIRVPLSGGDFLDLTHPCQNARSPTVLGPFADTLHRHLVALPLHFTASAE